MFLPINDGTHEGILDLVNMCKYTYNKDGTRETSEIPEEYVGKANTYRGMLMESLAETSEEMMDKFFSGEEFTTDEIITALRKGFLEGTTAPVFSTSATNLWGVRVLLDTMIGRAHV